MATDAPSSGIFLIVKVRMSAGCPNSSFLRSGINNQPSPRRWRFDLGAFATAGTLLAIHLGGWLAVQSLWHTDGEGIWFFGIAALASFLVGCLAIWEQFGRRAALIAASVVFGLLALRQGVLMQRLQRLRAEVEQVVVYLEEHCRAHGDYPRDLNGYAFRSPADQARIAYHHQGKDGGYFVSIKLTSFDTTARQYWCGTGWYYYPD